MKRSKAKPDRVTVLPGQMDLFAFDLGATLADGGLRLAKEPRPDVVARSKAACAARPAAAATQAPLPKPRAIKQQAQSARPSMEHASISDDWWTTKMVCVYLKISRKTLWERRRRAQIEFPRPVNLGGGRNVYRASEVRAWANLMAVAQLADPATG